MQITAKEEKIAVSAIIRHLEANPGADRTALATAALGALGQAKKKNWVFNSAKHFTRSFLRKPPKEPLKSVPSVKRYFPVSSPDNVWKLLFLVQCSLLP